MGLFDSIFGSDETTVTQVPLLTDQQKQIQDFLTQLTLQGGSNGLNLGTPFSGSLGDFELTDLERKAGQQIEGLLDATPQGFDTALANLTTLSDAGTNPNNPFFSSFQDAVSRATRDASNVLDREAAITGSRFGTGIQQRKQDLAAQQSEILGNQLFNLFESAANRSVNASQALAGLGFQDQANQRTNIQNALGFGSLDRGLRNAEAQAELNEFNRQRNEQLSRVGIGQGVFNRSVPFGVESVTVSEPSAFSNLLNNVFSGAGTAIGAAVGGPIGGAIGGGISSLFGGNQAGLSRSTPFFGGSSLDSTAFQQLISGLN